MVCRCVLPWKQVGSGPQGGVPGDVVCLSLWLEGVGGFVLVRLEELEVAGALRVGEGDDEGDVEIDGALGDLREGVDRVLDVAVAQEEGAERAVQRLDALVHVLRPQPVELEAEEHGGRLRGRGGRVRRGGGTWRGCG